MGIIDRICQAAQEKKAEQIVVMDMKGRSALCDTFIVMSAPSLVRVKAIVENIESSMKKHGLRARHREGITEAVWVLLDYVDIVVHVFYHEARKFYDLETLWGDAPRLSFGRDA